MTASDDPIVASVRAHGWHAIAVDDHVDSPPFTYSIGLCDTLSHPDVIVFGLEGRNAYGVIAAVVEDVRAGRSYATSGLYEGVLKNGLIAIRSVHPTQHEVYLGYAMGYYREIGDSELLRAVQVFWPDKKGSFPFDLACDSDVAHLQPRLELPQTKRRTRLQ